MEYYLGKPFGNEVEGRSQIVSSDVADTIEWILPSLLKIFTSGERVVRFDPVGLEDEAAADQATDYINHIFQKDNPGFGHFVHMVQRCVTAEKRVCEILLANT